MQKGKMPAKEHKHIPELIYIALTFLGFFLGVSIPESIHFLGTSSIYYIVLLLLVAKHKILSIGFAAWLLLFVLVYIAAICKLNKGSAKMLHIIMCVDIAISLFVIVYKLVAGIFSGLWIAIIGATIRLCYVVWVLLRQKRLK